MDNKKGHFHVVNLTHYEPPLISESAKEDWITYGENNDYFTWLIERYINSPTNNAVINNIVKLIYGKGLKASDSAKKPNDYAQMVTLFKKDCIKQLISDLKMLGQCAIQVIYSKDRESILEAYHIPIQLLRAEKCNEDGEIEAYYYSNDWSDVKKYPPKRIPAFGCSKEDTEIYYIKPYAPNLKYYSYVDYQGALPYCVLEEEIANYLINETQNSFSGTKILNFNNGVPSEEEREAISRDVTNKLTGAKGKRLIVAFNHDETTKTTIDDVSLNDAPSHYEYLSDESMRKVLLGHNVTSPLLFGVATSNGFGSNADELKNSFILFNNLVIKPYQNIIIDALENILAYNEVNLNLYFETLKPLEFTDHMGEVVDEEVGEVDLKSPCWDGYEQIGFKIKDGKKVPNCVPIKASKQEANKLDLQKYGHKADREWVLIDQFDVDLDKEDDIDLEIQMAQENANKEIESYKLSKNKKKSKLQKIRDILLDSTPSEVSELDWVVNGFYFITRYKYTELRPHSDSREFCEEMMSADLLYRKEDIDQMSRDGVNGQFAEKGKSSYDILRFKGGVNCYHMWKRQIFIGLDTGTPLDPESREAQQISIYKARKYGYNLKDPKGTAIAPIEMPNQARIN